MTVNPFKKLDESQSQRVLSRIKERSFVCPNCGSDSFEVGRAMELGHIWHNEQIGSYMVALTCESCRTPTGIRLRESEFLSGASRG